MDGIILPLRGKSAENLERFARQPAKIVKISPEERRRIEATLEKNLMKKAKENHSK